MSKKDLESESTVNAPIFLLLGTSTAGKTTAAEKIVDESAKLSPEKKLDWEVVGQDSWQVKNNLSNGKGIDAEFHKILEKDDRFEDLKTTFENLPQTDESPNIRKLYFPILKGVFNYEKGSLNLLNKEEFDKNCDNFVEDTGGVFSKEALQSLQSLAADKHDEFSKVPDKVNEQELRAIFGEAIENSKNGKVTIIDAAPLFTDRKVSAAGILKSCMEEQNHECPTHVALIHLSVPDLIDRMDQRNAEADKQGNKANKRQGSFPFDQYANLFEPQQAGDAREVVGEVTRGNLVDAVKKFGEGNSEKLEGLLNNFGLSKNAQAEEKPVKLVPIYPSDSIHDSKSPESATEIAKLLLGKVSKQPELKRGGVDLPAIDSESRTAVNNVLGSLVNNNATVGEGQADQKGINNKRKSTEIDGPS